MPIRAIRATERNATRSIRKGTFGPPGTLSTVETMRGGTPQFSSTTSRPKSLLPGKQRSARMVRLLPMAATKPERIRRTSRLPRPCGMSVTSLGSFSISIGSRESLAAEAAMEGDDSPQPARLQAIIAELCGFLNALVTEETGEILGGAESDGEPPGSSPPDILIMAAGAAGAALIADLCKTGNPRMQRLAAAVIAKIKHSQ